MNRTAHPFTLIFGSIGPERFPAIADALGDARGLDAFLVQAPAIELLREMRPDEGVGEAIDDFVAIVHAAFLYWRDGQHDISLDAAATHAICHHAQGEETASLLDGTTYIQLEPMVIWGRLADGENFEPLDGWFAIATAGVLRVVGCFGIHAERPGLSVVTVEGPCPTAFVREDGSAHFAPTMPGGDAAKLHAVASPEELLLLAWRAVARKGKN